MIGPQIVSGGDLDDILASVSGDVDVVGAIEALAPQLGQAIRSAGRSRSVIGSSSTGKPLNTHLPMINGNNAVAAAASVSLTGTPLRNFKPNGLVVMTDGVAVTVDSVTIANIPQFAASTGNVPSSAFRSDAVIPFELDWMVVPQNQSVIVTCTNRHAATACAIYGAAYGKYTLAV